MEFYLRLLADCPEEPENSNLILINPISFKRSKMKMDGCLVVVLFRSVSNLHLR